MRKLLLITGLVLTLLLRTGEGTSADASELTDDYMDIAAGSCISGKYAEAIMYLDKILAIEPDNAKAKQIKTDLEQITKGTVHSYLYNTQLRPALDAKRTGEGQKEFNALSSILNSEPDNAVANYLLAELYRENDDCASAALYYEKAAGKLPQCHLGRAACLFEKKDYTGAVSALNNYLKTYPKSDMAYALRAKTYLEMKSSDNALSDITAALALNDDISYKLIEAKILFAKGNYRAAKQKFEALTKEIQTSEVYKYIGLCEYEMKNYMNALLSLDKAIILSDETLEAKYDEILKQVKKNEKNNR